MYYTQDERDNKVEIFNKLRIEIIESYNLAESEVASEKLAGNIVKEAYWNGELQLSSRLRNILEQ